MSRTVCGVCGWDKCRCNIMSGNVISWAGTATMLIPGPSAEELMVMNRWLQDQNAVLRWQNDALQTEVERLREALTVAAKAEREACAKVCDNAEEFAQAEYGGYPEKQAYLNKREFAAAACAAAIRARGET